MTGQGTYGDPLVPTNWDEFVEAIGKTNVYIDLPENLTWDMNEILPTGIDNTIPVNAHVINGNGLVIKNPYVRGTYLFEFVSSNTLEVNDINIINANIENQFINCKKVGDGYTNTRYVNFCGCNFSGISTGTGNGIFNVTSGGDYNHCIVKFDVSKRSGYGCTFNFESTNDQALFNINTDTSMYSTNAIQIYFGYIIFNGKDFSTSNGYQRTYYMRNCLVDGKFDRFIACVFRDVALNNAFTTAVVDGRYWMNDCSKSGGVVVLNRDKQPYTSYPSICLSATEEDFNNAQWLHDHGFPAGV